MSPVPPDLGALIANSPTVVEAFDTSTDQFRCFVNDVDEALTAGTVGAADDADRIVREEAPDAIGLRVALKIAKSRQYIRAISESVDLTLLNPVYKETGRMQPRSAHPHGEDSIRYKAQALDQITALNPLVTTRLIVIDDGCPDESGLMAAGILGALPDWEGRYEVLFLENARRDGDPDVPVGLTAKDGERRSVKGGAVLYGMRRALRLDTPGRHVVVDNDADLSILPDQLGLLLDPILKGELAVVAGSRREPESAAVIGDSRASRGSLFISIWQHLLPELATRITDTNRAFKAFDSTALAKIIDDIETYTFPYQIEVLQAAMSRGLEVGPQAVAYVDSEAASTQDGEDITETYVDQVRQIISIALRYGTISTEDPLISFVDGVDDQAWLEIEQHPPTALLNILAK